MVKTFSNFRCYFGALQLSKWVLGDFVLSWLSLHFLILLFLPYSFSFHPCIVLSPPPSKGVKQLNSDLRKWLLFTHVKLYTFNKVSESAFTIFLVSYDSYSFIYVYDTLFAGWKHGVHTNDLKSQSSFFSPSSLCCAMECCNLHSCWFLGIWKAPYLQSREDMACPVRSLVCWLPLMRYAKLNECMNVHQYWLVSHHITFPISVPRTGFGLKLK